MMWLLPLLMVLGMVACLGLYSSLKSDVRVRAQHAEERIDAMLLRLEEATPPEPALEEDRSAPIYVPLRSGMNLSRRTQALRLLRQGEDIAHVAAALAVPRAEIELLIRVQELMAHRAAPGA